MHLSSLAAPTWNKRFAPRPRVGPSCRNHGPACGRLSQLQHMRPALFPQRRTPTGMSRSSFRVSRFDILRRHGSANGSPIHKTISCVHAGAEMTMRYDHLVIATGAKPVRPNLPGSKHEGVFVLHTMGDSFAVHRYLTDRKPRAAVLVGAGYIGLEMADALTHRGLEVTLLCRQRRPCCPQWTPPSAASPKKNYDDMAFAFELASGAVGIRPNGSWTPIAAFGSVDFHRRPARCGPRNSCGRSSPRQRTR